MAESTATAPSAASEVQVWPFTARELRNVTGSFATGVTVITTQGSTHPYGMTANSFSSVSLDPPLILVCVIRETEGERWILENGVFAVNILSAHQEEVSRYFASRSRPRGEAAFQEISHSRAASGSPIIDDVAGYLDCRLHASHEAGDHTIFIGEVMAAGLNPDVEPLLFHGGRYRFLEQE